MKLLDTDLTGKNCVMYRTINKMPVCGKFITEFNQIARNEQIQSMIYTQNFAPYEIKINRF